MSFGSYILSGVVARILVHPSLKIRQQTALYSDSIPRAIITLIRINTHYYVLIRIFLQKCCFVMSFVVFTHYYVLMLVSTYYRPPRPWPAPAVPGHCRQLDAAGAGGEDGLAAVAVPAGGARRCHVPRARRRRCCGPLLRRAVPAGDARRGHVCVGIAGSI